MGANYSEFEQFLVNYPHDIGELKKWTATLATKIRTNKKLTSLDLQAAGWEPDDPNVFTPANR